MNDTRLEQISRTKEFFRDCAVKSSGASSISDIEVSDGASLAVSKVLQDHPDPNHLAKFITEDFDTLLLEVDWIPLQEELTFLYALFVAAEERIAELCNHTDAP